MWSSSPASASEAPPRLRLLVVDDSPEDRESYRRQLAAPAVGDARSGPLMVIEECESGDAALARLADSSFDCLLLDYQLPDWDGLSLLDELVARGAASGEKRIHHPLPAVILLTGRGDEGVAVAAMKRGAQDYLVKGRISGDTLARAVQHAVGKVALERELAGAHQRLEGLVEERTRELALAIRELRREVEERQRAEGEKAQLLEREQEARRQAEEANRLKDDFLATVSHELRTPLNAILGWAAVLRAGRPDPATVERAADVIARNSHAQAQLISDLLDMSAIVTGKLRLEQQPVDLAVLLHAVEESVRPTAVAKGVALTVEAAANLPRLLADPARLQQVVLNLVANAVKFTAPGGRVELRAASGEDGVEVEVRDDGIGISADFLPFVFDRFRQRDSSTTRVYSGLGLGLAIARHLVEAHGGTIAAESDGDGKGATFRLRLPAASGGADPQREPAPAVAAAGALTGMNVLVVEDDADSREVCQRVLEGSGATVRLAPSSAAAWELLCAAPPDVLVSDIGLPGEDGYSLLRRLRASTLAARGVPAMALTAYAGPEDAARAQSAGYQLHLPKPVAPAALVTAVAALASGGRAGR